MKINVQLECAPFSIGVEIDGGKVLPLVKRGTPLPVETKSIFETVRKGQFASGIHILKGDSVLAAENQTLVHLLFTDSPRIEIVICISYDGLSELFITNPVSGKTLFFLLPDATNGELQNTRLTYSETDSLKAKVTNLVSRLANLSGELKAQMESTLGREIRHVLYAARVALVRAGIAGLQSSRLCLETLINELYAIKNNRE